MAIDVLAVGAHPDDVEMTCAGLVVKMKKRGYATGVVHLTGGQMGTRGTAEEREREAKAAARVMGVDHMEILGLQDGRLRRTDEAVARIAETIRRLRPRVLIAPFPRDPHPDHASAGQIVAEAAHCAELKKYPIGGEAHYVSQLIFAMHRTVFAPTFIVDITDEFEAKKQAVLAYRSQVSPTAPGEPETRLSSPQFLRGWEARFVSYGMMIGRAYGEPFFCEYPIPLEDPVAVFATAQQRRMPTWQIGSGG